jgi:hypothetical protein
MRNAVFLATLFGASMSAVASATSVISPNHPQTYAYCQVLWHQLYVQHDGRELVARITFSNLSYASDEEPRRDEAFDFRFPGVNFDTARRAFIAHSRRGDSIVVARLRSGLGFCWIDLAPGTKIYLLKQRGRVTAILTATDHSRAGAQWIETDDNWSLQNILIALFGEFFPDQRLTSQ